MKSNPVQATSKVPPNRHIESHLVEQFVKFAIECDALSFGDYRLKSGKSSPYFFNLAKFHSGAGLSLLAECYANLLCNVLLEDTEGRAQLKGKVAGASSEIVLYGPAYKGIFLVAVLATHLKNKHGIDIDWSFNRKEAKDHGEGGELVGAPLKGKQVIVIDDVLSMGTAARESIELLQKHGAQVIALVVALDRQETSNGNGVSHASANKQLERELESCGAKMFSIASLQDIVEYLSDNQNDNVKYKPFLQQIKSTQNVVSFPETG